MASAGLNIDNVGALVVGGVVLCDGCVNKFIDVPVLAGDPNSFVLDDKPNENVGFGF